jgi:hypothetical protein
LYGMSKKGSSKVKRCHGSSCIELRSWSSLSWEARLSTFLVMSYTSF